MATEPRKRKIYLNPEQEIARRTRRSFIALGVGAAATAGIWYGLETEPEADGIPGTLRSVLGFNERLVRSAVYSNAHLAKTYPAAAIGKLKVNGNIGSEDPIDLESWRLEVRPAGRHLSLDDIRALPRYEEVIDFKCIEGWSTVTQFAGARFSDFTAKFAPGSEKRAWIGLQTPDDGYCVGLDMPSALHPQTLLAYEMNGKALEPEHGAPLRLVTPVKYGIKSIKRIGRIGYSDQRPTDYWAEEGYDYYAGL